MAYTFNDLRRRVERLNEEHRRTDKTATKFDISQAYGGYKVVLKYQDKYGGGAYDITRGHLSAKETAFNLGEKDPHDIRYTVKRAEADKAISRKRQIKKTQPKERR